MQEKQLPRGVANWCFLSMVAMCDHMPRLVLERAEKILKDPETML